MGMIEDILKALDRIPIWKRVSALPTEFDALKARVEALEARLAPATVDACPSCRAMTFKLIESRPEAGPFGELGAREYVWQCSSCRYEDIRQAPPGR
jgi:hypothetical protein